MTEELKMLHAADIIPHPNNPRKDLGDIEELTESIKKNGIMQNLTVIPSEGGKYMALIGHRRLAAVKAAGLDLVPAKIIEGLSEREQVGIMLEENMQRNDLTPIEQAEGFQMMLDLGETEESIAEKTGFSRTTVRHRLEIAKLDKRILKKKASEDDGFQLSLSDLMALEKIESVAIRNAILDRAESSSDLRWKIKAEVESAKRKKAAEKIIEKLKAAGIPELPANMSHKIYDGGFKRIENYPKDDDTAETMKLPEVKEDEKIYYYSTYHDVTVYRKEKTTKAKETAEEKEFKAREKRLKELARKYHAIRRDFIKGLSEKALERPTEKDIDILLDFAFAVNACTSNRSIIDRYSSNVNFYGLTQDEMKEVCRGKSEHIRKYNRAEKLIFCIENSMYDSDVFYRSYDLSYKGDDIWKYNTWNAILEMYGFSIEDEEIEEMLHGSHECYKKE